MPSNARPIPSEQTDTTNSALPPGKATIKISASTVIQTPNRKKARNASGVIQCQPSTLGERNTGHALGFIFHSRWKRKLWHTAIALTFSKPGTTRMK